MNRIGFILSPAAVVAIALGALDSRGAIAQGEQEYVPDAEVKVVTLHQGELAGSEGKEVIIKRFTLPAGYVGGRHYHPGPVFVYVVRGELTIESEGATETHGAGDLYPEPLGTPMQARNQSATEELEIVVFQVGDTGNPMMISAD